MGGGWFMGGGLGGGSWRGCRVYVGGVSRWRGRESVQGRAGQGRAGQGRTGQDQDPAGQIQIQFKFKFRFGFKFRSTGVVLWVLGWLGSSSGSGSGSEVVVPSLDLSARRGVAWLML